jgi:hypothetical protein
VFLRRSGADLEGPMVTILRRGRALHPSVAPAGSRCVAGCCANRGMNVCPKRRYRVDAIVPHGMLQAGVAFLNKSFASEALGRKIHDVLG